MNECPFIGKKYNGTICAGQTGVSLKLGIQFIYSPRYSDALETFPISVSDILENFE
jgi:hypothetical protein